MSGMTLLVASEAAGQTAPAVTWDGTAGGQRKEKRPWMPRLMRLAPVSAVGRRLDEVMSAWRRRRWARLQGREARGTTRGPRRSTSTPAPCFLPDLPTFVVGRSRSAPGTSSPFPRRACRSSGTRPTSASRRGCTPRCSAFRSPLSPCSPPRSWAPWPRTVSCADGCAGARWWSAS